MRQPHPGPGDPHSTRRALIVAADRDTASALVDMLQFFGFEAQAAASDEEALRLVEGFSPAIVLIDISPPAVSGAALVTQLRAHALPPTCKFVALTQPFGRGTAECTKPEFDAQLALPVSLEALLATLVASGSTVLA